jgi:hypothetical protein
VIRVGDEEAMEMARAGSRAKRASCAASPPARTCAVRSRTPASLERYRYEGSDALAVTV